VEYLDGPDHQIALKPRRLRVKRACHEVRKSLGGFHPGAGMDPTKLKAEGQSRYADNRNARQDRR
jgi:hypothetical protein